MGSVFPLFTRLNSDLIDTIYQALAYNVSKRFRQC